MCWTQISPRKQIAESNRLECKSLVNWCGVHPQMCDPIETPWWQKINSKSVRRGKKKKSAQGPLTQCGISSSGEQISLEYLHVPTYRADGGGGFREMLLKNAAANQQTPSSTSVKAAGSAVLLPATTWCISHAVEIIMASSECEAGRSENNKVHSSFFLFKSM